MEGERKTKRKTGFERALSVSETEVATGAWPLHSRSLTSASATCKREGERESATSIPLVLRTHWISLMHCTTEMLDLQEGDPVASK